MSRRATMADVARSLRTSRSRTVGVLIPDLTNPLFPPLVRGMEDVLLPRDGAAGRHR